MSSHLQETLLKLKELENEYFKKFNQFYPTLYDENKGGVFGPSELFEMAIEAEVLLTSLGQTAVKRLQNLGFNLLFPFNNPVDWYNWKTLIAEKRINHTIYFSISTRIATEFKRMELHIENDTWDRYCELNESEFSVSKQLYSELFEGKISEVLDENTSDTPAQNIHHINIGEFSYNEKVEQTAISNLEALHKQTGIWSNVASVASTILKIAGIKI